MSPDSIITLKDYVDSSFDSIRRAIDVAYASMEKRLDGMNEFRETLRDQTSKFVTREEMDLSIDRINFEIQSLREFKAVLEGKASQQSVNVAYVISVLNLILGVVGILIGLR